MSVGWLPVVMKLSAEVTGWPDVVVTQLIEKCKCFHSQQLPGLLDTLETIENSLILSKSRSLVDSVKHVAL